MTKHCWHMGSMAVVGKLLTAHEERCCWCGVKKRKVTRSEKDPNHGPHVSARLSVVVDEEDPGACVERPRRARRERAS